MVQPEKRLKAPHHDELKADRQLDIPAVHSSREAAGSDFPKPATENAIAITPEAISA